MNSFKKIIHLLVAALLVSACVSEIQMPAPGSGSGQEAFVTFQVGASARSNPSTRVADTAFENDIESLVLFLASDRTGTGFVLDSMVVVNEFEMISATIARFDMTLQERDYPTKFMAVANMPAELIEEFEKNRQDGNAAAWGAGSEVEWWKRNGLITRLKNTVHGDGEGTRWMTMSGEAVIPTLSTNGKTNLHIPLLRVVARADLRINLGADSKPFTPASATVYRALEKYAMLPSSDAYDPKNPRRVIAPTPTYDLSFEKLDPYTVQMDTRNTLTGTFATTYVGESMLLADKELQGDATCIVVGGYYDGSTELSYYRIDFNSGIAGHPLGQVLRNWQYIFDITKVTSMGYLTETEAAENPAHSMTVQLQMWDENVQSVNFVGTGDYMYVNNNNVQLAYGSGSQQTFVVRSTLPFEWQLGKSGTVMESTSDEPVSDSTYIVSITHRESGTEYIDYTFTITARKDNTTSGNKNEAGVFLSVQDAVLGVSVTQKSMSVVDRKVHVLSLTDELGSLGIYYEGAPSGNTSVSAYHMRSILQNKTYFGPNSEFVKFGGFTFDQYTTSALTATSTVSLDQLRRALEPADIVILPYADNPPQSMVDVIVEWAQKPYHVLFVFADVEATTNTLARKKLDPNLAWYPTSRLNLTNNLTNNTNMQSYFESAYLASLVGANSSTTTMNVAMKDLIMASQTIDNLAIMGGTFGMPDQGATSTLTQYPLYDGVTQFAIPGSNSNVTPLAVFEANIWGTNSQGYTTVPAQLVRTKAFLVGVDIPRTIVYIGESQLFELYLNATAPYDGSGLAGTPYKNSMTVLMSNIWAWAVKNVLAQVKGD